ncbi:hypothetical protein [Mucilaginibacter phyllosphaerae]|uniref:MipA/OmpV family protein n=1 Tax=Mucilaginibacter phyllosphaerae TaxID=1812349 RepID=A0A4Y8ADT6_9SPHI|nr:hypothetical protein [Mucilaginibacter phyllosphaerae]MBB3970394.1 hypothetical protein [Mucilaginibacter phyllosphaerae]TEW66760.1 hypothetical protein E2R65_10105 [Mucilaginibacter phyllosphaerae]GGH11740.1 hypothetical protein GCM10007352_18150 [Mucilaginibacter phyllosphaerae]
MRYFGFLLLIITCSVLNASAAKPGRVAYRDSYAVADTDTLVRKNSVSAGITYGSDALFFGRTGPIRYPFMSTDIIFNTKSGFFVYGSALKVLGYKPLVDEIDLGGGYYYRLSKKFTGTLSYTRFIFNKEANIIKSSASNDINWKNTLDWKLLKTSATVDYLFGKSYDIFTTITNSKYYESSFNIFNDQDFLSINPSVSLIFGTQNFVQRYSVDHQYRSEIDNINTQFENGKRARANAKFNMLNYSFKLPLAYNMPHYTLEASYKYSIPVNVEGALKNRRESFFNFTFYYVFY